MVKTNQLGKITMGLAWTLVASFYFYEIILRMLPSITSEYYSQLFGVDATGFSFFAVIYYVSYTLMQIPAGLLVDYVNLRKILYFASLCCVLGFLIITQTHYFSFALLGRLLIGFGSAFAYVSALKAATLWLAPERFGFISCILDSLGMLGAVFTNFALTRINLHWGIHQGMSLVLLIGMTISLAIYTFLPRQSDTKVNGNQKRFKLKPLLLTIRHVSKNRNLWRIGLISALFYLPSSVVGDTWGIPYLETVYHYPKNTASLMMSCFFLAWAIFGPIVGLYSDRIKNRLGPIIISLCVVTLAFSLLIYLPQAHIIIKSHIIMFILFFIIGMGTGAHPLVFALAKEQFSVKVSGTVVATTNMLTMVGGLIFQPVIGLLLDWHHHTPKLHHMVKYNSSDYSYSFSILPGLLLLATLSVIVMKHYAKRNLQQYIRVDSLS